MKRRALVMYAVHAVLLNLGAESTCNLIYNGHALVGFLPVKYEEHYSTVEGKDKG